MTTRHTLSIVTRLAAAAVIAVTSAGCGSELLRTGRAPVFLSIVTIAASAGGGSTFTNNLLSDVATSTGSIFNDLGRATIRVTLKDQSAVLRGAENVTSPIQSVTLTRYRVNFRRADGRNTPGVDVPFSFDGGVTATINVDDEEDVVFDIVRHANKAEPPLRNLRGIGGQLLITTVAEITFFGRDQNGNEVTVTGLLDVTFGDFPDPS
jgi:hypothetical protein